MLHEYGLGGRGQALYILNKGNYAPGQRQPIAMPLWGKVLFERVSPISLSCPKLPG